MASAQVVETSVIKTNSPSQDSSHPDDLFQSRYVTPGFKPFSYEYFLSMKKGLLFFEAGLSINLVNIIPVQQSISPILMQVNSCLILCRFKGNL